MRIMIAVLLLAGAVAGAVAPAAADGTASPLPGFELVAEGVYDFHPLSRDRVLLQRDTEDNGPLGLELLDLRTGEIRPWNIDWAPEDDGWAGYVETYPPFVWRTAPDGEHVFLICGALAPEEAHCPGKHPDAGKRWILVLVSDPDGSNTHAAMIGAYAGDGPDLALSGDGGHIIGSWCLECRPDGPSLVAYLLEDHVNCLGLVVYDVAAGELHWEPDCPMPASGFNRFRDIEYCINRSIREYVGDETVRGMKFANYLTGGVLGDYLYDETDLPDHPRGYMPVPATLEPWGDWVLPDAALTGDDRGYGLAWLDGRFTPCPYDYFEVLLTIRSAGCLFRTERDGPVRYGVIDWAAFTVEWSVELPPEGQACDWDRAAWLPGSDGLLVLAGEYRQDLCLQWRFEPPVDWEVLE